MGLAKYRRYEAVNEKGASAEEGTPIQKKKEGLGTNSTKAV